MRLFERYLIRRGNDLDAEYLHEDMHTFTRDVEDSWHDDDFRIALLVLDEQSVKATIVIRWWWFGWHEEEVNV